MMPGSGVERSGHWTTASGCTSPVRSNGAAGDHTHLRQAIRTFGTSAADRSCIIPARTELIDGTRSANHPWSRLTGLADRLGAVSAMANAAQASSTHAGSANQDMTHPAPAGPERFAACVGFGHSVAETTLQTGRSSVSVTRETDRSRKPLLYSSEAAARVERESDPSGVRPRRTHNGRWGECLR